MIALNLTPSPLTFALPLAHTTGPIVRGTPEAAYVLSESVSPGADMWTRDTSTTRVVRAGDAVR